MTIPNKSVAVGARTDDDLEKKHTQDCYHIVPGTLPDPEHALKATDTDRLTVAVLGIVPREIVIDHVEMLPLLKVTP
jgi:hypothetical protein